MQTTTLPSNVQIVDPERNAVLTSLPDRGAEPAWSSSAVKTNRHDDTAEQPFVVVQSEFLDSPVLRFCTEDGAPKKITISKIFMPKSPDRNYKSEVILPNPDIVTANGGVNYGDGALFCSQGQGNIACAFIYMDIKPPRPFNDPNDVVVPPIDGSIRFTDPNYGIVQGYRSLRVVADGLSLPNGIAFSHDCKVCYITDTSTYDGTGGLIDHAEATIYAYDIVRSTGSTRPDRPYVLVNRRVFACADCGAPDGIKVDLDGNVYTGCLDGVQVWDSDSVLIGKILVPGGVANFCFTDPGVLLLFNENRIYEARLTPLVVQFGIPTCPLYKNLRDRNSRTDRQHSRTRNII
ncbi:hypothetical protein V1520DRAFT_393783 [Lipomyces starkeyi]